MQHWEFKRGPPVLRGKPGNEASRYINSCEYIMGACLYSYEDTDHSTERYRRPTYKCEDAINANANFSPDSQLLSSQLTYYVGGDESRRAQNAIIEFAISLKTRKHNLSTFKCGPTVWSISHSFCTDSDSVYPEAMAVDTSHPLSFSSFLTIAVIVGRESPTPDHVDCDCVCNHAYV